MTPSNHIVNEKYHSVKEKDSVSVIGLIGLAINSKNHVLLEKPLLTAKELQVGLTNRKIVNLDIIATTLNWEIEELDSSYGTYKCKVMKAIEEKREYAVNAANYLLNELIIDLNEVHVVTRHDRIVTLDVCDCSIDWIAAQ